MGKPTICIGENKDADQLRGYRYSDRTIPPLLNSKNFKLLACFFYCTDRFVSDLFGNHIVGFSTRRLMAYRDFLLGRTMNLRGIQFATIKFSRIFQYHWTECFYAILYSCSLDVNYMRKFEHE